MSLGLPSHLSRAANSRALATAARWAGGVCLAVAAVNVGLARTAGGVSSVSSWVALAALLTMVALLLVLARRRGALLTVLYLLVGTACTYFYVVALFTGTPSYRDTELFVVALPVVAMTLVGGTGTGALAGILWATLGFALAETAVLMAAASTNREFRTDAISLGAYLLLIGVLAFDGLTRGARARAQSTLHRAVRDVRLVDLRRELIAGSVADVHDTVLSDLTAIAVAEQGALSPRLRARIDEDLRQLTGPDSTGSAEAHGHESWFDSEFFRAVDDARDEGLAVEVTGDRDVIGWLGEDARRDLGRAVRQCLINVVRHSGSATAEVALSVSGDALSVMIVDEGRGFVPVSPVSDRLGLRRSVQERLSRWGGTVTVYSSEDIGTTVILVVPIGEEEA